MARDTEYNVDGEGREETSTKTKMSPTQVKKAFQKIMQDFPSSPDEQNKYMEEWTDVITESNAKKMNLMHFVIEENAYECVDDEAQDPSDQDEDRGRHMSLLRWLLNHRPVLLTGQNNEGRTPIHEAARNDGNLLQVILDSFAEFNVPVRKVEPDLKSLIQANASALGSIEALSNYLVSWSTQFMGMTDVTRVSLTEAIIKYLVDANIAASVDRRAKLPTSVDRRAGFSNLLDRRAGFQPPGEAKSKTDYFRRSIQIICKNNSTCLHAAVENKIRQPSLDALKTIIRLSAADILATPNKDGDTPLHLAVNLESLSTESTELVKELAAKNPTAIYTKNNKGETPYRILTDSNRKSAFQRSSDSSRETKKMLEGENGKSNPKEDIEEILKYYWVRERPLLEVAETLYSGNQQKGAFLALRP
jgi:ankyrin repeat protein